LKNIRAYDIIGKLFLATVYFSKASLKKSDGQFCFEDALSVVNVIKY
jgi:hypothetical protein